jgi:hypothetical protein
LPIQFYTRFEDKSEKSPFNVRKLPFFKEYFVTSAVQYHNERKHFRIIKAYGTDTTEIIDGNSNKIVKGK